MSYAARARFSATGDALESPAHTSDFHRDTRNSRIEENKHENVNCVRDEPGSGGVRVGQTRSDLDCRVVATSRRVAPTECDSRLPLFGRGSTCRLRLLDSWPPRAEAVVFDSSRGSTRVSRPVAPTESDSSDKRRTWAVAQLVRLVRLVRQRCHDAARLVRLAVGPNRTVFNPTSLTRLLSNVSRVVA